MSDEFTLGRRALEQLTIVVRRVLRQMMNEMPHRAPGSRPVSNRMVVLDEDLYAAEDRVSIPSTAQASIQAIDSSGELYDTGEDLTVTSRFENISVPADTLMKVEFLHGEWQPYASDCPSVSSSSGLTGPGSTTPGL